MRQIILLPTELEQIKMPEGIMNFVNLKGMPKDKNFGVFYSDDLSKAVVVVDLTTEEMADISKVDKAKIFIEESMEFEISKDKIEINNSELKVCEDFDIDILNKRLP